jgi:flavodoxin
MNMSGKQVAIFGLGDQNGYGFNFLDAAGISANEVLLTGATLFGLWSNEKYQFNESKAKQDEYFLCLGVEPRRSRKPNSRANQAVG